MANPKGIITRKDIIEDEALKWGEIYTENIKEAIKQNKILVESVKELNKQVQAFKVANSQKDYITAKQAETLATQQAIDAIKKQEAAEISADKIKRSAIATMEAERKQREATQKAEKRANDEKERSKKLTIEERVQNEIANKVLKQEALERLGLVSAYTKLNNARTEAKNKLRDLIASESASTAEIKKAQKEFENLDQKVRKADAAVGDFAKNVGNYPLKGLATGLKDLVEAFGIAGGIGAFVGIMKSAYDTVKKFDQAVADLSAITGASGKELDYLKKQAIELGKSTKGGAIAVVEAYKLIGSAKPELLENVKALNQVTEATLTLSKAAGMEMPEAATALTDAMNQFGADASQAAVFVDALAAGAKYGAAEIPQTTEALLKFGAVARTSNISIHESVALIELLAENGIKGAEAGTKLRNVLLKISAPDALPKEGFKALSGALKESGVSMEYLKDKTVPVEDKLKVLKPLLRDNANIVKIFGDENATAAINIIEHNDRLRELTKSTKEQGVADEQAAIKMDTVQGKTERLSSTYDSLVLSIGSGRGVVSEFFKFFIEGAEGALNGLLRLNTSWNELYEKAKLAGQSKGLEEFRKQFNGIFTLGISNEKEVAEGIKVRAQNLLNIYKKEFQKNEKELKEWEETGFFGKYVWGEGSTKEKAMKAEKERLIKALAEQQTIIDNANEKINPKKSTSDTVPQSDKPNIDSETDAERKKRLDKAKKAVQDKLDLEKKLADSSYELQKQRLEQTIKFNDEIVADDLQSDEVRVQALTNSQKKQEELLLLTKNHLLEIEQISYKKELEENKGNKVNLQLVEKNHINDKLKINEDYSNKLTELNAKTQKELDKINQFDEAKYTKELEGKISKQNLAMNSELEAENKRFNALNDIDKKREDKIAEHEQKVFNIKKKYAIEALKLQINNLETELIASDALPKKEQLSAEKRQKIAETLSKAKLDLSEVELSNNDKKNEKYEKNERERAKKILEISRNLTTALGDLANTIYNTKIQNIDAEINRSNEYYNGEIEKAGNDQRKKDMLEKEANEKRKKLEAEKRKEQQKQAVFEKAFTISQIGLQTALAIIKAAAATAPTFWGVAIAAGIGALQLGAALATPIPKYKHGRKSGPEELAIVGDGGRREIIERASGLIEMTPATDTLVKLERGDKVHGSVEEYYKLQRAVLLNGINMQGRKATEYQVNIEFEKTYGKDLLDELKRNTKAIEKNKSNVTVNIPKIDFTHELWKMKNKNWS
ncbi:MAG TPA: phage tail tape measure protein [Flavobacterium sp.]|jgi:TP901 family phage tail tape measure protein